MANDDGASRLGRRRKPTDAELSDPESLLRASSVLRLDGAPPSDLDMPAQRIVALVDGFRPVARLRVKSGLNSVDFRSALREIASRGLVSIAAVIEEATLELSGLRDEALESAEGAEHDSGLTMPRQEGDVIPPHVMAEIEAMVEEEVSRANADDAFEDATDVVSRPALSRTR